MKDTIKILFVLLFLITSSYHGQEIINLYTGEVPNSKVSAVKEKGGAMFSGVTNPTLQIFLPEKEKSNGAAVILIPGGGYGVVVYQGEGVKTAKDFVSHGIAAFVLKYRLPNDSTMIDKKIGPLQDGLQAVKVVRENADKWGVSKNKIGVMGFSAGGHLASTVATHFNKPVLENNGTSLRPDFQILVYPVISMQDNLTHVDSRTNLLGKNPSKELIDEFSNELQVTDNTPPAYITHAADDKLVDVDNSIGYFEKLRHKNVSVEMHIYPQGGHGFIFRHQGWMEPLFEWMKKSKWISE